MNRIGTNPATCIPSTVALGGAALTSPCWTVHIEATLSEGGRKTGTSITADDGHHARRGQRCDARSMSRVEPWASVAASRTFRAGMSQRQGAKICGVSLSTFQYHLTESRSGSDRKSVTGSAATKARRSDLPSTMPREPRRPARMGQGAGEDFSRLRSALAFASSAAA